MALKPKYEVGDIVTIRLPEYAQTDYKYDDFIVMSVDYIEKDTIKYWVERLHPKNKESFIYVRVNESNIDGFACIDFNDIKFRIVSLLKAYYKAEAASTLDLNITLNEDGGSFTISLDYDRPTSMLRRQTITGGC